MIIGFVEINKNKTEKQKIEFYFCLALESSTNFQFYKYNSRTFWQKKWNFVLFAKAWTSVFYT